tara:strand:- start:233 stop:649 length:417 start_codon:yes stop_codon:yes gene_type:complete
MIFTYPMPKAKTKAKSIPQYKQRVARYATLKKIFNVIDTELKQMNKDGKLHDDFKKHGTVEQIMDSKGNLQFDDRGKPKLRYKIEINALGWKNVTLDTEYKNEFERTSTFKAGEKTTIRKYPQNTDTLQAIIDRVLDF